ncbi:hypothetical protein [Paraflavitalea speifideaquila]|uniref:hypothetical protein n=1 Tax=Paraflavitalea speifideaquila TaxID=3076558 RepID=UPI0028E1D05A|nr:hypothetical protein [Paraflavitalea speifideiaquila]
MATLTGSMEITHPSPPGEAGIPMPAPLPIPVQELRQRYISDIIPENIPDDRHKINHRDKVILIVEDDTNFAKSLLDYTRHKGYKGVVSVRGDEALALAINLCRPASCSIYNYR